MSASSSRKADPPQALYRRYRPQRFIEVVGQKHAVDALRNLVHAIREPDPHGGPLPHAVLMHGPAGTGKTTLARIFARALNCEHLVDGDPCNQCTPCVEALREVSYTYEEIDAATNSGVEDMRKLKAKLNIVTPGYLTVVLDEAHMLSKDAVNAALKMIEEPSSDRTKYVLCTTEPKKLLETMWSRCMPLALSRVPDELLLSHATRVVEREGLKVDEAGVREAVRRGSGSVRAMLSSLEAIALGGMQDEGDRSLGLVDALVGGNRLEVLRAIHAAIGAGIEPRPLCEESFAHLSALFVTIMGAPEVASVPDSDGRRSERAKALGAARCVGAMDALGEALAAMKSGHNNRVHLEVHLCRYAARVEAQMAQASRPKAA